MNLTRTIIIGLTTAFCCAAPVGAQSSCPGDLNLNGEVNGEDLGILLAAWGPCVTGPPLCRGDLDRNGVVDGDDLGLLLANWGCPTLVPAWATLIEAFPDPSVVGDPKLRADIIASRLAWRVRHTATQIEMLLVPPGTFQRGCIMGSIQHGCHPEEQPVHQVTLTNAFYLGRYEVTQAQWQARMGYNPSFFREPTAEVSPEQVSSRPVEQMTGSAVQVFLAITDMRLPTEAEWEYACRAGTQTPFPNGSTDESTLGDLAWFGINSEGQTRPVGSKGANALGLHDMLGNVWEWVSDFYSAYTAGEQTNPAGPASGLFRVIRGCSWNNFPSDVRSSFRSSLAAGEGGRNFGFRVAKFP